MSNYSNTKATIDANIKQNGQQLITGNVLNGVLNAMLTNMAKQGYQYGGVAHPADVAITTDSRLWFLAAEAGTYTNKGGFELSDGEVAILKYDTSWHKDETALVTKAIVPNGASSTDKLVKASELAAQAVTISQNTQTGGYDIAVGGGTPTNVAGQEELPTTLINKLWLNLIGTTGVEKTFSVKRGHRYKMHFLNSWLISAVSGSNKFSLSYSSTGAAPYTDIYALQMQDAIPEYYEFTALSDYYRIWARGNVGEKVNVIIEDISSLQDTMTINTLSFMGRNMVLGTNYLGNISTDATCLADTIYYPVSPSSNLYIILGEGLQIRIAEYNGDKIYIKQSNYGVINEISLSPTTEYIRISVSYSGRGFSSTNPVSLADYSEDDFSIFLDVKSLIPTLYNRIKDNVIELNSKQPLVLGSRNLFDITRATSGYIDRNGVIQISDILVSDYIYCNGEEHLSTNYGGRDGVTYVCFFDENKNFLSSTVQDHEGAYTIPSMASFVRLNLSVYSNNNMVVFGDSIGDYEPYKGVDYIFEHLVEDGESVSDLNADKSVALAALKNAVPNTYASANKNLFPLFSIATDIHSDWERLKRLLEYSEGAGVNSMLCLGDIGETQAELDSFDWQNFVLGSSIPVLAIPGNHEFIYNSGQSVYTGYTDETLAAKIYNSALVSHNGETHPSGKNYWHKDISYSVRGTTKKLRIIGIYQYEFIDEWEGGHPVHTQNTTGKDMPYYKQAQIDWLIGLLDSADANTDVVILMHHAPTSNMERVDNNWNPSQNLGINILSGVSNNTNNDFIPEIINAWINGTSVNSSSTMGNDDSVISVNHTFTSAHHGKFVGYITGHSHWDAITKIAGMNEQYVYANNCISSADTQQNSDLPRSTSGKMQDSFNIIAYDCLKHRVGIVKIGSDIAVDIRDKKYTCNFNYTE